MISDISPLIECMSNNLIFTQFLGRKYWTKIGISFTDFLLDASTFTATKHLFLDLTWLAYGPL
jgi:hypothetical protein